MLLHATYTIMSVAAFHELLDNALQVDFPGPRDSFTLRTRFEQAPNSVILALCQQIVVAAEDQPDDALFDVLVQLLKESGEKHLDTPNLNGETLLMGVADFKYLYGFKTLIDAGANPNAYDSTLPLPRPKSSNGDQGGQRDTQVRGVLHRVVSDAQCIGLDCDEIINSMLQTLQACARFRINPTVSSFRNGKQTYLQSLKEHDALLATYFPHRVTYDDITNFIAAKPTDTVEEYMRDNQLDLIKICIRTNTYGPDLRMFNLNDQFYRLEPNVVPTDRWTLLHWAIAREASDSVEFVRYLLNAGANPNVWCSDMESHTALMMALQGIYSESWNGEQFIGATLNKQEIVRALVRMPNIDLNVIDGGVTALQRAAAHNLVEVVDVLLAGGADVNAQNKEGYTALMLAARNNHLDMVTALMNHPGIDLNLRDKDGETAILSKRPAESEPGGGASKPNKRKKNYKIVDTLPFSRLKL